MGIDRFIGSRIPALSSGGITFCNPEELRKNLDESVGYEHWDLLYDVIDGYIYSCTLKVMGSARTAVADFSAEPYDKVPRNDRFKLLFSLAAGVFGVTPQSGTVPDAPKFEEPKKRSVLRKAKVEEATKPQKPEAAKEEAPAEKPVKQLVDAPVTETKKVEQPVPEQTQQPADFDPFADEGGDDVFAEAAALSTPPQNLTKDSSTDQVLNAALKFVNGNTDGKDVPCAKCGSLVKAVVADRCKEQGIPVMHPGCMVA